MSECVLKTLVCRGLRVGPSKASRGVSRRVPPCAVKTCAVREVFALVVGAAGTTSKQMSKGP